MRIEIQQVPELSYSQACLLNMHSVLNILNVIKGELRLLQLAAHDETILRGGVARIETCVAALTDHDKALDEVMRLNDTRDLIFEEINFLLDKYPQLRIDEDAIATVENLRTVFSVLRMNCEEFLKRGGTPYRWEVFDNTVLERNLWLVL